MLDRLSIQNYAIIDQLDIDFSQKLNVLTGETGAGKSIIIGALGLILGQRADSGVQKNREKKCIIEGVFRSELPNDQLRLLLEENDLDLSVELVVRREIAPNGKSRAFVNDTPVNLLQLSRLSALLVDLHQQFDTLELVQTDFQRDALDALGSKTQLLKQYREIFLEAQNSKRKLDNLKQQKQSFDKEFDYHQFQFNELEEAGFKENELEELDKQLKVQTNAEDIKTALLKTQYDLRESETPLIIELKSLINGLQNYSSFHSAIPALAQRLQSVYIELQDVADEAGNISDRIQADSITIEKINERLAVGYRLLKKHGVKTTNELLEIKNELNKKLEAVLNIDEEIITLDKQCDLLLLKAEEQANEISIVRKDVVKPLEQKINKMLVQVGMPNARFRVDMQKGKLGLNGSDEIQFLFDANKSGQFQPLGRVASGGELSRLMLCIKSLVAQSMNLPTLIFDEIDTGISGEAAKQVGIIMKDLATARQVVCITHQPQIAGKADAHYLVYKAVKNNSISTSVRLLDKDERIVTIAKMLSGEKPTSAAMENAKELIMN